MSRPDPDIMLTMRIRLLLLIAGAALVDAGSGVARSAEAIERPNIIFILTDDLRWNTLGCMGDAVVHTPRIDRLAADGVTFTQTFATTPICMASRVSIFSGQYKRRHQIDDFRTGFTPDAWALTYPVLLRQAGYRAGFIGKFGVGGRPYIQAMASEFDYWRGLAGQGGEYFIDPNDPEQKHTTARMGDQALEFLAGCGVDQPFCLSLSFNAPHARDGKPREFQPDLRDETLHATDVMPVPPAADEGFFQCLPPFVQRSEGRTRWQRRFATPEMAQATRRDYYRLVAGIDREVGRILDTLAGRGLEKSTVVIFTSDNGWLAGDRGLTDKWLFYEESIRIPLIVFDPRLAPGRRGARIDALALNIDFAPTLLDLAGVTPPDTMQGRSLKPLLAGAAPPDWRTEFFVEHHFAPTIIPPSEGVRTSRWAYLRWLAPNPELEELYDLIADPQEARNLAGDPGHASVLQELRQKRLRFLAELR